MQDYPNAVGSPNGVFSIDADHPSVMNETKIDIPLNFNVINLTGIQAFAVLDTLLVDNGDVAVLPQLPSTLEIVNLNGCNLTSLPTLPSGLIELNVRGNNLSTLPVLPSTLKKLITTSNSQLSSLPTLPNGLEELIVVSNDLSTLPTLPTSLKTLYCNLNSQISSLPTLPTGLQTLDCSNTSISSIPAVPISLRYLSFQYCNVTTIPTLPNELGILYCQGNSITTLPDPLPDSLYLLKFNNNQVTVIPELPEILQTLDCRFNPLTCLPVLPQSLYDLEFDDNVITCLPNYLPFMTTELAIPLCIANDPIDNPNLCSQAEGITGFAFKDTANNCLDEQWTLHSVPLLLENTLGDTLQSTSTAFNGLYMFSAAQDDYLVRVDTSAIPTSLEIVCPVNNEIAASNTGSPVSFDNNFGLECNGFDIAAMGATPTGYVFPGQTHSLSMRAGDVSNFAGMQCADGISGEILVSVSGPADTIIFNGMPTIINDSTANYVVSNFGTFDLDSINWYITTDTTATVADSFYVSIIVSTPMPGDLDPINDTVYVVYPVVNSYDPNKKVVYPQDVQVGFDDPFTYTIYFQNTGSAPAINIRLEDIIDPNLDLSTFEFLAASHNHVYTIDNSSRKLTVRYPNIFLVDSTTSFDESIGYFKFRINPYSGLSAGTVVQNTVDIYFDFNTPITTNTTENLFYDELGVNEIEALNARLYPNPATHVINIVSTQEIKLLEVFHMNGTLVKSTSQLGTKFTLDVADLERGTYIVRLHSTKGIVSKKFVKIQ
ncbi:MAG: hypothetical protein Crog4KO_18350 [Crocinitomicaceae bacterium]